MLLLPELPLSMLLPLLLPCRPVGMPNLAPLFRGACADRASPVRVPSERSCVQNISREASCSQAHANYQDTLCAGGELV